MLCLSILRAASITDQNGNDADKREYQSQSALQIFTFNDKADPLQNPVFERDESDLPKQADTGYM